MTNCMLQQTMKNTGLLAQSLSQCFKFSDDVGIGINSEIAICIFNVDLIVWIASSNFIASSSFFYRAII